MSQAIARYSLYVQPGAYHKDAAYRIIATGDNLKPLKEMGEQYYTSGGWEAYVYNNRTREKVWIAGEKENG